MPARKRERVEPTDDWSQLQLRLDWPEHTPPDEWVQIHVGRVAEKLTA